MNLRLLDTHIYISIQNCPENIKREESLDQAFYLKIIHGWGATGQTIKVTAQVVGGKSGECAV